MSYQRGQSPRNGSYGGQGNFDPTGRVSLWVNRKRPGKRDADLQGTAILDLGNGQTVEVDIHLWEKQADGNRPVLTGSIRLKEDRQNRRQQGGGQWQQPNNGGQQGRWGGGQQQQGGGRWGNQQPQQGYQQDDRRGYGGGQQRQYTPSQQQQYANDQQPPQQDQGGGYEKNLDDEIPF